MRGHHSRVGVSRQAHFRGRTLVRRLFAASANRAVSCFCRVRTLPQRHSEVTPLFWHSYRETPCSPVAIIRAICRPASSWPTWNRTACACFVGRAGLSSVPANRPARDRALPHSRSTRWRLYSTSAPRPTSTPAWPASPERIILGRPAIASSSDHGTGQSHQEPRILTVGHGFGPILQSFPQRDQRHAGFARPIGVSRASRGLFWDLSPIGHFRITTAIPATGSGGRHAPVALFASDRPAGKGVLPSSGGFNLK